MILPPVKSAKRFRASVRTLGARWMVKRLVADTFFLHLHRESLSCSCCSTTQVLASPGQATNPTEMTLVRAGSAPGHLLTARSAGSGPRLKTGEMRSDRLHRRLHSHAPHGLAVEQVEKPSCTAAALLLPTSTPAAPSRPSPAHSLVTQVGVLSAQQVWLHKQLQCLLYVCGLLPGQRRGQGQAEEAAQQQKLIPSCLHRA